MKRYLLTLIAAALLAPAAATATPTPTISGVTATGSTTAATGSTASTNVVTVAWTLAANEYACALTLSTPQAERTFPLAPAATGITESVAAIAGERITATLAFVSVSPTTKPDDACYQTRATMTTTATAQGYTPPAPPAAPAPAPAPAAPAPAPAPADTSTTAAPTAPTTVEAPTLVDTGAILTDLQRQVDELRGALAALTDRVDRMEKATDAAWLAFGQALEAGADDATAAATARGTFLNALYGLGDFAGG